MPGFFKILSLIGALSVCVPVFAEDLDCGEAVRVQTEFAEGCQRVMPRQKPVRFGKWEHKNADGNVVLIENYNQAGRLDGEVLSFFPSGKKKQEMAYENGKASGEWVFWFENGRVQETRAYRNGKLHGLRKRWREGREPAAVGTEPLKAKKDTRVPDGMECFVQGERKPIEVCSDPKFDTNSQSR